ncbi:MAG: phage holin family protein [Patescibacteria group bacterium]|jgi:putative membrane protein
MTIILRWVINALALLAAAMIIPGFHVESFYAALIAALVLGLINALVRPILLILTLPITIVTLGLFIFVINAGMLWFMSTMVKGITIEGFWPAVLAAIFLWAVGVVTSHFIKQASEK